MTLAIIHTVASMDHSGSGISACVGGLAKAQSSIGAAVRVLTLGQTESVKCLPYPEYRFANDLAAVPIIRKLGVSSKMRRAVREAAPQIVHTHGLWMFPNIYRAPGAAFVIAPHGMLTPAALSFSPLRKRLFRALAQEQALKAAMIFHATAESEYEDIRRFGLRQPVAIIPNGIDLPPLHASRRPNQRQARTVLSLGRIHPIKSLDVLINAWARVEPAHPDWCLRIVGPDERGHAEELRAMVRALSLRTVSVEPPVFGEEKFNLMAQSDLFVLPSQSENFALTVAESLAAGVPVISSRGAPWSGLETHGCGWWVEHGIEALSAALRSALALKDKDRRAMGARGRDWMERAFSWHSIAEMSVRTYEWVLGNGFRPDWVKLD